MPEPMPESEPQAQKVATEAVRFRRSLTVDPKFAGRAVAATIRYVLLTPARILRITIPSFVIAVLVSVAAHPGGVATVGVFFLVLPVLPLLQIITYLFAYFPMKKRIRERLPVGSQYSIEISDDSLRLKDEFVASDISYKLYKSLRATRDFVLLFPRRGRLPSIVPRELFTPESLSWLESQLNAAR